MSSSTLILIRPIYQYVCCVLCELFPPSISVGQVVTLQPPQATLAAILHPHVCALILCWSAQEPRAPTLVPHIAPVPLQQDERNYHKPGKTQNCRPRCSLVGQELLVEAAADDKKHPFSLEKLGVNNICATEDVSVFANRGTVVSHSPEVGASPARSRLPGTARPRQSSQQERCPRLPARGRQPLVPGASGDRPTLCPGSGRKAAGSWRGW